MMLLVIGTAVAVALVCYAAWLWFTQEGSRAQRVWAFVRDVVRLITGV